MVPAHLKLEWMRTIDAEVRRLGGLRSLGGSVDAENRWSGYWLTTSNGMALARVYIEGDSVRVDHHTGDAEVAVLERTLHRA